MQPHQGASAPLQCAAEGRQELSFHQDRCVRGVPSSLHHAACDQGRLQVFRSLRQRGKRQENPRPSQEAVPVPLLHKDDHGHRSPPLPGLLHQPLCRALHRGREQRGVSGDHRPGNSLSGGQDEQDRQVPGVKNGRGGGRTGIRACGDPSRPAQSDRAGPRGPEGPAPDLRERRHRRGGGRRQRGLGGGILHPPGQANRPRPLHNGRHG